jgi:hypothetical protein
MLYTLTSCTAPSLCCLHTPPRSLCAVLLTLQRPVPSLWSVVVRAPPVAAFIPWGACHLWHACKHTMRSSVHGCPILCRLFCVSLSVLPRFDLHPHHS